MEPPRYYELGNDNIYCVHFANKQGLSIDQIREIFTEWGNVVGVSKAGDDYGYRFVRYRNEVEVFRCIEALRNHPTIRLLPKRPKQQSNDRNNGQRKNNQDSRTTPWGSKNSENFDKFNAPRTESWESNNVNNPPASSVSPVVVVASEKNQSPKKMQPCHDKSIPIAYENSTSFKKRREILSVQTEAKCIPENTEERRDKFYPLGDPSHFEVATTTLKNNEIHSVAQLEIPKVASDKNEPLPSVQREIGSNSTLAVSSLSPEVIATEIPDLVDRSMPGIPKKIGKDAAVANVASMTPPEEPRVVDAEEIIVANVPLEFGENFILHLFRRHEPICISPMKLATSLAIHFCVVFFPTVEHAKAVENEFDNHELGGKKLIVLRSRSMRDIVINA